MGSSESSFFLTCTSSVSSCSYVFGDRSLSISAETELVLRESLEVLDLRRRSLQMVLRACEGQSHAHKTCRCRLTLQYSLLLRFVSNVR